MFSSYALHHVKERDNSLSFSNSISKFRDPNVDTMISNHGKNYTDLALKSGARSILKPLINI